DVAAAQTEPPPPQGAPAAKQQRRSLSSIAMDISPKEPAKQPAADSGANATMAPAEAAPPNPAMQPSAAKPPPQQPLNVIQKTFRAEALARLQRATLAECGFVERLVVFWSNHFCI